MHSTPSLDHGRPDARRDSVARRNRPVLAVRVGVQIAHGTARELVAGWRDPFGAERDRLRAGALGGPSTGRPALARSRAYIDLNAGRPMLILEGDERRWKF